MERIDDNTFPLTNTQKKARQKAFIEAIDPDAVCRLASLHNGGKPCRIFKEKESGGFNVCFFVEFEADEPTAAGADGVASEAAATADGTSTARDATVTLARDADDASGTGGAAAAKPLTTTTKWVVRVPTLPTVHSPWEKIRGEVATIRYVEANTKIKVPHVHAFGPAVVVAEVEGTDNNNNNNNNNNNEAADDPAKQEAGATIKADDSNPIGHAYMIIDYIAGERIDIESYSKWEDTKKDHLFNQLIDIYAELVELEFDKCGSLTLNDAGEPVLGPLQSMHLDQLRMDFGDKSMTFTIEEGFKSRRHAPKSHMFSSTIDYALFQHHLIRELHLLPDCNMSQRDVLYEEMALHNAQGLIFDSIDYESNHGPFVLSHTDPRGANIIVNDDVDILGIVDWEWSAVIPRQFLVPPHWITSVDVTFVGWNSFNRNLDRIHNLLWERCLSIPSSSSSPLIKLERVWQWSRFGPEGARLVPYLLRHHNAFLALYRRSVLYAARGLKQDEFMEHYACLIGEHSRVMELAEKKLKRCQRYDQYLRDNGLYEEALALWKEARARIIIDTDLKDEDQGKDGEEAGEETAGAADSLKGDFIII